MGNSSTNSQARALTEFSLRRSFKRHGRKKLTRMDTSNGKSIIGLIGQLPEAAKSFVRKEIDLFKTEISEKISSLGRNLVALLVGGFIAVTALTLLLNALPF